MASKLIKLQDLKTDPKNANKHSEYGTGLLEKSARMNGAGRSILISDDNVIIAGNGFSETAAQIGLEDVIVVETTGKQIVAVKRTDIKSGTKEFYNMALADNIVAQKNIVIDANVVEAIVEEFSGVKVWGDVITERPATRVEGVKEKKQKGAFFSFAAVNKKLVTNKVEYYALFRNRGMDLERLKKDKKYIEPFVYPVYKYLQVNKIKNIMLAPSETRAENNGFHFLTAILAEVKKLINITVISPLENKKNVINLKESFKGKTFSDFLFIDDIITRGNTVKKIQTLTGVKKILIIICNH